MAVLFCSCVLGGLAAWRHSGLSCLGTATNGAGEALGAAASDAWRQSWRAWAGRVRLACLASSVCVCVLSSVALGGDDATGPLGPREMDGRAGRAAGLLNDAKTHPIRILFRPALLR
jgi:hypothetical protein